MKMAYTLLFCYCLLCCTTEQKKQFELPANGTYLLTQDSSKTWKLASRYNDKTRMNMEGCFLSYRQTFMANDSVFDTNELQPNCGPSVKGNWRFTQTAKGNHYIKIESPLYKTLGMNDSTHFFFKIVKLTSDSLVLRYNHRQFNQRRTITDYMVPEEITIPNRNFHH